MSEEEKAKGWLKKAFKGEVLDGFLEAAKVKTLEEFEKEEEGSMLVKSLIGEKDGEKLIVGLMKDGEKVKFVSLCQVEKPKEGEEKKEEHVCHVREVADGVLYDKVKESMRAIGYEVKEVEVEGAEPSST